MGRNPPQEKRWCLYILLQYLANPTQRTRHEESQIFTIFVPVLRTLCIIGLKILQPFCAFSRTFLQFSYANNCGCGRRGGLMVSALDSGARGPGSSPGRGQCVVFLGKTLYSHSASLHPGV